MLLVVSSVIVINILEIVYPTIFNYQFTKILKKIILMYCASITGYSLAIISVKNKLLGDIIETSFIVVLLIYLTSYLVQYEFGIILVVIGWIGSTYWLGVETLRFIKYLRKTYSSQKQRILQIVKSLIEILTFVVVIIELLNVLVPLFVPQ